MTEKSLRKANEIQNEITKLKNEIRTLKSVHGNMMWESKNPPTKIVVITKEEVEYLINVRMEKSNRLKEQLKELT